MFVSFFYYNKLEKTVLNKISELPNKYNKQKDKEEFIKLIKESYLDPKEELYKKIDETNKNINNLKKKQDALSDDKFNGIINTETYQRLFENTDNEIKTLNSKLSKLKEKLSNIKDESMGLAEYIKVIDEYLNMNNPTKEMLNKIVEKNIYIKTKK